VETFSKNAILDFSTCLLLDHLKFNWQSGKNKAINKDLGQNSQYFLGKFVRFFVTLGLKILKL